MHNTPSRTESLRDMIIGFDRLSQRTRAEPVEARTCKGVRCQKLSEKVTHPAIPPPQPSPRWGISLPTSFLPQYTAVYRLPRRATEVAAGEPTAGRRPTPTPEPPAQAGGQP